MQFGGEIGDERAIDCARFVGAAELGVTLEGQRLLDSVLAVEHVEEDLQRLAPGGAFGRGLEVGLDRQIRDAVCVMPFVGVDFLESEDGVEPDFGVVAKRCHGVSPCWRKRERRLRAIQR